MSYFLLGVICGALAVLIFEFVLAVLVAAHRADQGPIPDRPRPVRNHDQWRRELEAEFNRFAIEADKRHAAAQRRVV